jgi:hypothetical protein
MGSQWRVLSIGTCVNMGVITMTLRSSLPSFICVMSSRKAYVVVH